MTDPDPLQPFKQLLESTESLCDSLRDLRRTEPEKFFGQPVEEMYRSFEAALDSFYRAKIKDDL